MTPKRYKLGGDSLIRLKQIPWTRGLTGGDIAGIVIAVLVVVGLAGVLIFQITAKKQANEQATDYQDMDKQLSSDTDSDYNKL